MWLCLTALTILLCSKPALSVPPVICYISNSEDGEGVGQTILVPCDDTLLSNKPSIPPTPVPTKSPSESPTLKPTTLCHDHRYLSYDIGIPSIVNSITCDWVKSVSVSDVKLQFCNIVIPFGGENKQIKKWCPEACDYDCAPTGAPTKSALPTMQPTPEAQTSVPTVSPTYICEVTPGERSESISDYIKSSVGTTDEDLNNSLSPQSLAFNWIINEDPLHLCPDDPKLSQRYVAATLYYSMGGAKWITSTNFLTEMDECEWYGFSCTDGKISYMDLDDNKLSGSIPSEIGHLQMLTGISLDGTLNELAGTIPDSIGLLENLEVFDLDFNNLTGSIPESIYDLRKLEVLDLNDNNLSGSLSHKIGNMTSLSFVQMQGNYFSGRVPSTLKKLVNLETLMLDNNNFEGRINSMICDNNLYAISADCGGNEPKVTCDCCTYCYPLPLTLPSETVVPTTTSTPTEIPILPTTSAPKTSAPRTSVPLTSAPTTTSPPTTSAPVAPTETAMPTISTTTEIPILPTTYAPTTSARTTSAPLTYAPTTSAPTTSSPTASLPTTAAPTTSAPIETSSSLSLAPTISPTPPVPCLEEPDFSVTIYGMEVDCNLLGTLAMIDIAEYCEVSVSFGDITYPIKSWCPAQCGVACAV
mmetsp:Transcript_25869/g.51531  ORF Transcript_25869/g.51531 Transcript_25869/m.51531 type:complete len:642 (+) Transcript_25869:150-2075(+)